MTSFASRQHPSRVDSGFPPRRSENRGSRPSDREPTTFGLLPESESRNKAFTASLILNVTAIALMLFISIFVMHHQVHQPTLEATQLLLPVTPVKPVRPIFIHPHVTISPPTRDRLHRIVPKFSYKRASAEVQPKRIRVHMNNMSVPVLLPYRAASVALQPQPKVGTFSTAIPTAVANNQGKTSTKIGGFGDPYGVHPNPSANRTATITAYGSFSSAIGGSSGSGTASKGAVGGVDFGSGYAHGVPGGGGHGKVAFAGFSNRVVGGNQKEVPRGTVKPGAFQDNAVTTNAPKMAIASTSNQTAVKVISHPKPEYTAEAKQLKIQGEVVLEVRFSADGQVHVIRVLRGLGHGLDQQAIRVAEQTQFKPATRDGKPVDSTTYYRIDFQLA